MIAKETIDNILDSARIDEVVGEFVRLKRRGANLIGNCPFHNEKTPSFTVSPVKGIYKCFGCGKAGNAVNFIMEHEHYSYPEALRYLAKKFNIEIAKEAWSEERSEEENQKEALFIVSAFAQKYFSETLLNTQEGKAVGLSYFTEREFSNETIKKFQLGYSLNAWESFTTEALKQGYKLDYLTKTGLTISTEGRNYDRFRGRVLFPIHNLSGRVIGFGGRVLVKDEKSAKYVNSPESEIYHKSKVLYGAFFARKAILEQKNCYLVEGYTDVISLHQAGIENVVASSGTSLTTEQIRLIKKFSDTVTILYDGDAAGIKASFRGIDMILAEGLNVKVVLFPDGEDPDSFARKHRKSELLEFISSQAKDFITFKTSLLLKEIGDDPIKKAGFIKEIVNSIVLIPDGIIRSVYVRECSTLLKVKEEVLINELNKLRGKKVGDRFGEIGQEQEQLDQVTYIAPPQIDIDFDSAEYQEKDIIRFLLNYGNRILVFNDIVNAKEQVKKEIKVAEYVRNSLVDDNIEFINETYKIIFEEYFVEHDKQNNQILEYFSNHAVEVVRNTAINLLTSPYSLSVNWAEKHCIAVSDEEQLLNKAVKMSVLSLKLRKLEKIINTSLEALKITTDELEQVQHLQTIVSLSDIKKLISKELGRIIIR